MKTSESLRELVELLPMDTAGPITKRLFEEHIEQVEELEKKVEASAGHTSMFDWRKD